MSDVNQQPEKDLDLSEQDIIEAQKSVKDKMEVPDLEGEVLVKKEDLDVLANAKYKKENVNVVKQKQVSTKKSKILMGVFAGLGLAGLGAGAAMLAISLLNKPVVERQYTLSFSNKTYDDITGELVDITISGDASMKVSTGKKWSEINKPVPYLDDYHFFTNEWYKKIDDTFVKMDPEEPIVEDLTLYAKFDSETGYRYISFSAGEGEFVSGQEYQIVEKDTTFKNVNYPYPVAKEEGFYFVGWKDDEGNWITENTVISTNMHLTAQYDNQVKFITFDAGEGEVVSGYPLAYAITGTTFGKLNKPTVQKEGYYFDHWEDEQGQVITDDYVINEDITVVAKYTQEIQTHYVIYDINGGSSSSILFSIAYDGETFGELKHPDVTPPTNETFIYWSDQDGKKINNNTPITDDITVVAQYAKSTNKVYSYFPDQGFAWIDNIDDLCDKTKPIQFIFGDETQNAMDPIAREDFNQPIYFGSDRKTIPANFLEGCTNFNQEIIIGENIESIGANFLSGCKTFNSPILFLNEKITEINNYFLNGCESFNTQLVLPTSVTKIDDYFLNDCSSFNKEMNLPSAITELGSHFMEDCSSFDSTLTLSSNLETIGDSFMTACKSFNQPLSFPYSLSTVGSWFLYNCTSYEQMLELPATIKSVGSGFCCGCDNLYFVWINNLEHFPDGDHNAFTGSNSTAPCVQNGIYMTSSISTEQEIKDKFEDQDNRKIITSILGNHMGYIYDEENNSLYYFDSLIDSKICSKESEDIKLTKINFQSNEETEITLSRQTFDLPIYFNEEATTPLTEIPDYFLGGCLAYNQEISLPASVTKLGAAFLASCVSYNTKISCLKNIKTIGDGFMDGCIAFDKEIEISSDTTKIGSRFMAQCIKFDYPINIPSGLTEIPEAFMHSCEGFNQTITIPSTIKTIGKSFMYGCKSFNQPLVIPVNITSIGDEFLYDCNNYINTITVNADPKNFTSYSKVLACNSSSALMYKTGINIVGTFETAFIDKYPNSSSSPYRNLKEKDKYTINFSSGSGGSISSRTPAKHIVKGTSWKDVPKPQATPYEGYVFNGWYSGSTRLSDNDKITSNFTATAKFSIKSFSVLYYTFDGVRRTSGPLSTNWGQTVVCTFSFGTIPTNHDEFRFTVKIGSAQLDPSSFKFDNISGRLEIPGSVVKDTVTVEVHKVHV